MRLVSGWLKCSYGEEKLPADNITVGLSEEKTKGMNQFCGLIILAPNQTIINHLLVTIVTKVTRYTIVQKFGVRKEN